MHGLLEGEVLLPGRVHGRVYLFARDGRPTHTPLAGRGVLDTLDGDDLKEAALELLLVVVGDEGVQVLDLGGGELVDVELQRLRIAHDYRAVVVVGRGVILLSLPADAGHPDEVGVLAEQVHDVAVAELGRVAHGLGRHGLDARLVGLLGGLVREDDREAKLGEEGVPEGVVLVHVERAGDAHRAAGRLVYRQRVTVKEQAVLKVKEVRRLALFASGLAGALLAAVSRDEAPASAEVVDGELAVVRAQATVRVPALDLEIVYLLTREEQGCARGACPVSGEQSCPVGAHGARDVRSYDVATREQLEGPECGVTHEGAALDDDVSADLIVVAQLDDLEERVLDDGVREARRHVTDGRPLLLGLLHTGVHEDGAAAAEVDGARSAHGSLCELLHRHAHGVGEVRDEGAAAGRAGLVEHDMLDDTPLDLQALHVLASYVQDELDVGHEGLGAAQVSDRLYLAGVGAQGLDQDALAVAGRGHVPYGTALWQTVVDVVHDLLGSPQDVAIVVVVPGVEELSRLPHDGGLHRGGAGVDTDEHTAAVALEPALGDDLGVVALLELLVGSLIGKEGLKAGDL